MTTILSNSRVIQTQTKCLFDQSREDEERVGVTILIHM